MKKCLSVRDLDLKGKKVLIRVDFNVPMDKEGKITDDTRIRASLPTIQYVLDQGGSCILMSHLGRPKARSSEYSLAPCAKRLEELLGKKVIMAPDCIGKSVQSLASSLLPKEVLLLENVRFYPEEEKPEKNPSFAKELASLADCYVNDAFGSAHRAHASTTVVASYFPNKRAAGCLLEKELRFLGEAIDHPKRPFYAIIGGAKVSTKLNVLKSLSRKVDLLFLGGGMAYTFLKAKGINTGNSPVEEEMLPMARELLFSCQHIVLPEDIVAATEFSNKATGQVFDVADSGIPDGYQGMDIGPKTVARWSSLILKAKTLLWNGPVGVFEFSQFAKGTNALAHKIAGIPDCTTIVGGGDSVAAIQQAGVADKISHLSTGGGASLEFLELGTLPGVEALTEKF
jgi:phosphoglycerate kinase